LIKAEAERLPEVLEPLGARSFQPDIKVFCGSRTRCEAEFQSNSAFHVVGANQSFSRGFLEGSAQSQE
jgi:hypothetical protein